MKRLNGKVALITGGNSGIGLATAKVFIEEGANVVITGRDQKSLDRAAAELGHDTLAIRADAEKLSDLDMLYSKFQEKHKKIDVLFVNAGVAQFLPVEKVSEKFFDTIFNTNTKGLFFTIQKAIPLLKNGASVILTGSSIVTKGVPGASVYAASKASVRSLARSFSSELLAQGIRVNVLSPGPIATPIFGRGGIPEGEVKNIEKMMASRVPLKRLGLASEVAKVALFLGSDDSSFMLGSEVSVDGGVSQL